MVKTFPLIVLVMGILFPLLFTSSIHPVPSLMGSLKFILIILLAAHYRHFWLESVLETRGGIVSVVNDDVKYGL